MDLDWGRENGWNGHFSGLLFVLTTLFFFPPFPSDTFLRFSSGLLLFSLQRRAATFGLPLPPDFFGHDTCVILVFISWRNSGLSCYNFALFSKQSSIGMYSHHLFRYNKAIKYSRIMTICGLE